MKLPAAADRSESHQAVVSAYRSTTKGDHVLHAASRYAGTRILRKVAAGALALFFLLCVLVTSSVHGARASVAPEPSPAPTVQALPQRSRSLAQTLEIQSSYGSMFGSTHDTVTIVHTAQGGIAGENDRRIDALIDALRKPCGAEVTPDDVGLTPEMVRSVSDDKLFPPITRGQRRWFDRTLTKQVLEGVVKRYYTRDFGQIDGMFSHVSINVSDSKGTVMSADSTAQQALMLPWSVTLRGEGTCASWNPQISHALAAYFSGEAADRLDGRNLTVEIAHAFIHTYHAEWTTVPVQERFGTELKRLSERYIIISAALQDYAPSPAVPRDSVNIQVQPTGGPRNLLLSLDLEAQGSRLPGLDAALAAAPGAVERMHAFAPIRAKLGVRGYNIRAIVPGSLTTDPATADTFLRACGADDFATLIEQKGVVFVSAEDTSPPRGSGPSSFWAVLPNGSAVLWLLSQATPGPVLGIPVPRADGLGRVAALFAADGTSVKSEPCTADRSPAR